jgi:hypothetical protein
MREELETSGFVKESNNEKVEGKRKMKGTK